MKKIMKKLEIIREKLEEIHSDVEMKVDERDEIAMERSEKWQESEAA